MRPVPLRTCVACRRTRPKRELVRLVHAAPATCHSERSEESRGGAIEIDVTGRREGRGAYLCPEPACWEKALKGAALEKALRGTLSRHDRERLLAEGRKMLKEMTGAEGQ
jgi:predicted RNA-binding protein YlxR (DUF448 family)